MKGEPSAAQSAAWARKAAADVHRKRSTSFCSGLRASSGSAGGDGAAAGAGFGAAGFGGGHPAGDGVQEAGGVAGGERRRALGDAAEQVVDPVGVGLGEVAEDVVRDQALVAGVADAEADAGEVGADVGADRADAVVAGGAAAGLDPHPAGGEVELVVEDDGVAGLELVELQRRPDGVAGKVHVGAGLQQQDLLGPEAALGDLAVELRPPGAKPCAAAMASAAMKPMLCRLRA